MMTMIAYAFLQSRRIIDACGSLVPCASEALSFPSHQPIFCIFFNVAKTVDQRRVYQLLLAKRQLR
jgi:hypothetical protein